MLRLVDANMNRSREGLRVLEDIARFMLNDDALSQKFRQIRHKLIEADSSHQLLTSRDAYGDVGAQKPAARPRGNINDLVTANSRRVQESLRVLEEFAQLPDTIPNLDSDWFKSARFTLYTLEKELTQCLLRKDKIEKLTGLYVIIDPLFLRGRNEIEVARQAIRGGAKIIQLRDKKREHGELLPIARQLRQLCTQEGVLFIINDYLDLALASDADGLLDFYGQQAQAGRTGREGGECFGRLRDRRVEDGLTVPLQVQVDMQPPMQPWAALTKPYRQSNQCSTKERDNAQVQEDRSSGRHPDHEDRQTARRPRADGAGERQTGDRPQ